MTDRNPAAALRAPIETLRQAIEAAAADPGGGKVLLPLETARRLLETLRRP